MKATSSPSSCRSAKPPPVVAAKVWARLVTVGLFVCASGAVYLLDSAKDAFDIILQVGAGTGLLYLVRWFWWRVNAWSEIVAMVSSFVVSVTLLVLRRRGMDFSTHVALLITIAVTTTCWMLTAFFGPQTDRAVLIDFYKKVRDGYLVLAKGMPERFVVVDGTKSEDVIEKKIWAEVQTRVK